MVQVEIAWCTSSDQALVAVKSRAAMTLFLRLHCWALEWDDQKKISTARGPALGSCSVREMRSAVKSNEGPFPRKCWGRFQISGHKHLSWDDTGQREDFVSYLNLFRPAIAAVLSSRFHGTCSALCSHQWSVSSTC
ncbi:unnamed protein product [Prorocentrum cordatum]|uniref:Uncharacterized protein n=1 Tax=Prorocentrum cordatum TaxID=2364126 RepID=A0ABN9VP51_9DINO|nr:unnamed protein product [Polarella glacialis]